MLSVTDTINRYISSYDPFSRTWPLMFYIFFTGARPLHPDHPVLLPGYPKDTTSVIGGSASLYCADTGDSLVDYRWLKWNLSVKSFTKADFLNGSLFNILHPVYHEQRDNDSGVYLRLTNLTMADQGLYTCLVSSIYTGFSYRSAFLTVKQSFKSKFLSTPICQIVFWNIFQRSQKTITIAFLQVAKLNKKACS